MSKKLNRKYRLHQKIKAAFRYKSKAKTIFVGSDYTDDNKFIKELQSIYNYQVQYEIQ